MWELALANAAWIVSVGCVFALMLTLLHRVERGCGRFVARKLGWRAVVVTGWLGVPLHELGHLAMAWLFGHRIVAWKLFEPDPVTGTLGYVRHAHRRRTAWQLCGNFFVGVAPVLTGGAALLLLAWWMMPREVFAAVVRRTWSLSLEAALAIHGGAEWTQHRGWAVGGMTLVGDAIAGVWAGRGPWLPLQIYLCVCVCSHLAPSAADMKSGASGVVVVAAVAAALSLLCAWFGWSTAGFAIVLLPLSLVFTCSCVFLGLYAAVVGLATARGRGRKGAGGWLGGVSMGCGR